ncbi:MAG: VWA domain-containing protein, partial [Mariprofundus sp.]
MFRVLLLFVALFMGSFSVQANTSQLSSGVVGFGDLNGNRAADYGILLRAKNRVSFLYVRDGKSKALIRKISFGALYTPKEMVNAGKIQGQPAVAILGVNDAGRVLTQVKRLRTGKLIKNILSSAAYIPKTLKSIGDTNGNGQPDLAIVLESKANHMLRVEIRDSLTGALIKAINYGANLTYVDFTVMNSATPSLALLAVNLVNDNAYIYVRNSKTGKVIKNMPLGKVAVHRLVAGKTGTVNWLSVLYDTPSGVTKVWVKSTAGKTVKRYTVLAGGYSPVALHSIGRVNANTSTDVVIAGKRVDGVSIAEVRDGSTGALIRKVLLGKSSPYALGSIADVNGNRKGEFLVMSEMANGTNTVLVRDAFSGRSLGVIKHGLSLSSKFRNGVIFSNFGLTTNTPSLVNLTFHAMDMATANSVVDLGVDEVRVTEDLLPVPPAESFLELKHIQQMPTTIKTVLLLDTSASVIVAKGLKHLKSAAKAAVAAMVPNQKIAIYQIDNAPHKVLVNFTSDQTALNTAIDALGVTTLVGGLTTNIYASMVSALAQWSNSFSQTAVTYGNVILITDGNDTSAFDTLANVVASLGNKAVYGVGVGKGIN